MTKDCIWLLWYNGKRMHYTLNYVSLEQYEQHGIRRNRAVEVTV